MAVALAVPVLAAGWLLTPLGISKIRATPTWSLYSVGAAVLCFTLLYWICDVRKRTAWALLVRPAGANTLLTYLLPDFYSFLISVTGFLYFETHFSVGWPGVVKSVVFTLFILAVSGFLRACGCGCSCKQWILTARGLGYPAGTLGFPPVS